MDPTDVPLSPLFDEPAAPVFPVVVNRRELDETRLAELERLYGVRPAPGRYWYDRRSGLYGVEGFPAAGLLHPGLDLGDVARDASGGGSGVRINGREIAPVEWTYLAAIVGTPILPGDYWLDPDGNAGMAGNPMPLVNLFAAAVRAGQGGGGGGGGGDNFWSTRFAAGNSNADNSCGYVNVPGVGPVGYGF